jgi:hypothetical protein
MWIKRRDAVLRNRKTPGKLRRQPVLLRAGCQAQQ